MRSYTVFSQLSSRRPGPPFRQRKSTELALITGQPRFEALGEAERAAWSRIPTTVVADETNRASGLSGEIKPVAAGMRCVGQALPVQIMVGDNSAIHHALAAASPGAVLVVDAGGFMRNAVWGGVTHLYAARRGLGGIVIDGCVRDVAELRASALPAFARGAVPNGPHKGFGGSINMPIQCGGVAVHPGDVVIGDDDGVVVVPLKQAGAVLKRCQARLAREAELLKRLEAGESTLQLFNVPPADRIG